MENPNYYTCNRSKNCSTQMRQYVMYRHLSATKWISMVLSFCPLCAFLPISPMNKAFECLIKHSSIDTPYETFLSTHIFQMCSKKFVSFVLDYSFNFESFQKLQIDARMALNWWKFQFIYLFVSNDRISIIQFKWHRPRGNQKIIRMMAQGDSMQLILAIINIKSNVIEFKHLHE